MSPKRNNSRLTEHTSSPPPPFPYPHLPYLNTIAMLLALPHNLHTAPSPALTRGTIRFTSVLTVLQFLAAPLGSVHPFRVHPRLIRHLSPSGAIHFTACWCEVQRQSASWAGRQRQTGRQRQAGRQGGKKAASPAQAVGQSTSNELTNQPVSQPIS